MTEGLSLIAQDDDDLATVAACLQDALAPMEDLRYVPEEKRFYMVVNRFLWEQPSDRDDLTASRQSQAKDAAFAEATSEAGDRRRHAAVRIDNVEHVRAKNIDLGKRGGFLSLLTIQRDGDHLNLFFSGGGVLQLRISRLALMLRDLGAAWPTQWRPDHDMANRSRN